jgi:hypothetical protein
VDLGDTNRGEREAEDNARGASPHLPSHRARLNLNKNPSDLKLLAETLTAIGEMSAAAASALGVCLVSFCHYPDD